MLSLFIGCCTSKKTEKQFFFIITFLFLIKVKSIAYIGKQNKEIVFSFVVSTFYFMLFF